MFSNNITTNNANSTQYILQKKNIKPNNYLSEQKKDAISFNKDLNSTDSQFLKSYLLKKASKKGVQIPDNIKISTSSTGKLPDEIKKDFKDIIYKDYKGFVISFFDLINQDEKSFNKELSEIEIGDNRKEKIKKLKNFYDQHYEVNANINGKNYNLTKLSDEQKEELQKNLKDKNLANFLINESSDLEKVSKDFSRKKLEKEIFYDAGEKSRGLVTKLVAFIAGLTILDHNSGKIINALGGPNSPLGKNFGWVFNTVAGGGDDVAGCYKDYFQDEVTLGKKPALAIGLGSAAFGVGTSIWTGKYLDKLEKRGDAMFKNAKIFPPIKKALIPAGIAFGIFSSGSSIASNIGTYYMMSKNHDKLKEKGLIKDDESKSKTVWKNYSSYEAYIGKLVGLASCVPAGVLMSSMIFSPKSIVKGTSMAVLGSIETLTACGFQKFANGYRENKIEKEKQQLVQNA